MKRILLMLCLLVGALTTSAYATLTTATLPDYSQTMFPPYPKQHPDIGTFSYTLPPGEDLVAATVSGIFGINGGSTAPVDLFLDGLLIAQCPDTGICFLGGAVVPWSYTFAPSEFSLLLDGQAVLTGTQLGIFTVALSEMTLSIETMASIPDPPGGGNPIPEPGTILLFSSGIFGLACWNGYRKKASIYKGNK